MRVVIQGDGSILAAVMGELRGQSVPYDLDLEFVSSASPNFDAKIVLTEGRGSTWATSTSHQGDPPSVAYYAFSTACVFNRAGQLAFTATGSGDLGSSANLALAKELARKLGGSYGELSGSGPVPETRPQAPAVTGPTPIPSEISGMPGGPGVYYKGTNGWAEIDEAVGSTAKARGIPAAMLSFGLAGIHVLRVYNGAGATARTADSSPVFFVQGLGINSREAAIIRLEQKRDHREVNIASLRPFAAKSGYPSGRVVAVKLSRLSPDVVAVTPSEALKPGEYLLSLYSTDTDEGGFDFGVVK
ncbi:MAG: hypothetical protein ACREDR_11650 [Blastocatellia bacterium]